MKDQTEQTVNKNDFIELAFNAKSNGEIFDTTNPKEAEKISGLKDIKPLIISVGNGMILKSLDEELVGKELLKEYYLHLTPEKAFGYRNPNLVKTYSLSHFKKQNLNPYPGMAIQLDNIVARVVSVSGGRVTLDFNNPLAGKEVDYDFTIPRKVTDDNEKINALQDFFFRMRFNFDIKDNKVIFKNDIGDLLKLFEKKFKQITGFDFDLEKAEEKSVKEEEKSTEEKETKEKAN